MLSTNHILSIFSVLAKTSHVHVWLMGDKGVGGIEGYAGGNIGSLDCVGVSAVAWVGLGDAGGIDEGIQTYSLDGIGDGRIDGSVVGNLVRNRLSNGDGMGLGDGDGTGQEFGIGTVVISGSLIGLDNGIRNGTAVVGGFVGAGVGKEDSMRPDSVEGKDEGFEVGTVECSLFGLGDGIHG